MRKRAGLLMLKGGLLIFLFALVLPVQMLEARTMKIGTDRWPPHEDIFNKDAPGFCTEVVRAVFQKMGVEITITQYPWARALNLVFTGKNDGLFCALYTEERAQHCYYPDEQLTELKYLLFINKHRLNELPFDSYDDLKGKRIGLVRAFAYPAVFMDSVKENAYLQEVESDDLNFKKLLAHRIDYTIADYANGVLLIRKLNLQGKVIPLLNNIIQEAKLYLVFSKKTVEPAFVDSFSKTLKQYKQSTAYREIKKKYYSLGASRQP